MKKYLLLLVALGMATFSYAQNVGIGTTTPDPSAKIEISSQKKGMLIPRMTMNLRDAITSPATGLLIYQTDNTPGFYYYNGTAWTAISGSGATGGWNLTGNGGTNPATNFLGTTDNQPLNFRINNTRSGFLGTNGNIFWGKGSGNGNTTGLRNIGIGSGALFSNTTENDMVAIGDSALYNNNNIFDASTAVGSKALYSNTSGHSNTAIGFYSLKDNTTGYNNTAIGSYTLRHNTFGLSNTATGYKALYNNISGNDNTANGSLALHKNTEGNYNTGIGYQALEINTTGSENTAIGIKTLDHNIAGTSNTAVGSHALYFNTSGNYNTAYGADALYNNDNGSLNTALGYGTDVLSYNLTNATAIGAYAFVDCSNCMVLGSIEGIREASDVNVGIGTTTPDHALEIAANSSIGGRVQLNLFEKENDYARLQFGNNTTTRYWHIAGKPQTTAANSFLNFYLQGVGNVLSLHGDGNAVLMGTLTQNSDMTLKTNILPVSNVLSSVLSLNGYRYQWKDKNRDQSVQIGLLAQEVQKYFPELVKQNDKGLLGVNYSGLVPVVIEAMKEQENKIRTMEQRIEKLEKLIIKMNAKN